MTHNPQAVTAFLCVCLRVPLCERVSGFVSSKLATEEES